MPPFQFSSQVVVSVFVCHHGDLLTEFAQTIQDSWKALSWKRSSSSGALISCSWSVLGKLREIYICNS